MLTKRKATLAAAAAVCGLALYASSAFADYSTPIWATPGGSGAGSNADYGLIFTVGQSSPVGVSTSTAYSLTGGLVSVLTDVRPPVIAHEPAHLAVARTPLQLDAEISDDRTGIRGVTLYYHEGGLSTFRQKPVEPASGNTYTVTLPASSISEKGLVYYIEATDNAGNSARYPTETPDTPNGLVSVRVVFTDLESPLQIPDGEYRMISLPGFPTEGEPDTVLVDDLGRYDRAAWRLGRWNAGEEGCDEGCYDEYPDIQAFYPGRAFWLIMQAPRVFDFSGVSSDIDQPFAVHLDVGWNQIATPFAFDTDWISSRVEFGGSTYAVGEEHTVETDTIYVEDNLIGYNGAYQGFQSVLEPWSGYWVYNASTGPVDLLLYPEIPSLPVPALTGGPQTADLLIDLRVTSGEGPEENALAGLSRQANDAWDVLDHRAPPTIRDAVRPIFRKDAWGRHSGTYMCDIRLWSDEGSVWEFCCLAGEDQRAALDIRPVTGIPEAWRVMVYDVDAGIGIAAGSPPYAFEVGGTRRFVLIAGTPEYIEAQETRSGLALKAQMVGITPNPFTTLARITFFLPRPQDVKLRVFSVDGRLIDTVIDSRMEGGTHTVAWKGGTRYSRAAPGIYFLRLETVGGEDTRKLIRVQ